MYRVFVHCMHLYTVCFRFVLTLTMDNVRHLNDAHWMHLFFKNNDRNIVKMSIQFSIDMFMKLNLWHATKYFFLFLNLSLNFYHRTKINFCCIEHKVSKNVCWLIHILYFINMSIWGDKVSNYFTHYTSMVFDQYTAQIEFTTVKFSDD